MEVGSVSASVSSALTASIQARVRQSENDAQEQTSQTQQSAQPRQAQQSLQSQQSAPAQPSPSVDSNNAAARLESEANRPVVNTNGQLVGTRVNTTA
jgi:hypothetical protein